MRQDDRAPFDAALHRARVSAYASGEFVGQESLMTAGEIRALAARAGIGPGVAVLDLCCGVAGAGRFLTRELGCAYLGVDASAGAIAMARERAGNLSCRFAVAQIPPLPAGPFDVVLLLETMLAFENKDALAREIFPALRPGGRFAFTLEEGPPLTTAERAAMPDADTVWLTPLDELAGSLERAGLVVTWQEDHSRAHRAMAQSLADAFAADAEDIAARIGCRALDELLAAHRLWIRWLDEGRVRKLALVSERRTSSARSVTTGNAGEAKRRCEDANVTEQTLARARAGDEDAFRELTDPYRRELQLHVYRIVGSAQDAEDLLQETLLAAWRGLERFEQRASVRAWLYRIATNRSLDALRAGRRRPEAPRRMTEVPEPTRRGEPIWLEPYPDVLLEGLPEDAPGPDARYETKEAIALAFVAGLQHLAPQQRAVLVLRDVLGFRAGEVAEMLQTSEQSVNSLLRRARAAFESRLPSAGRERAPLPHSQRERDVAGRFADAVEAGDIDGMVALLTDDAWVTMPPEPYEYQGPAAIGPFLRGREVSRGRLRLVPTRANGQPAFACYLPSEQAGIARPYAMFVLALEGDRICAITWFADSSVFAHFGLPPVSSG